MDTIEPGVDFAEAIFYAVAACKVLLAVIGPGWLTATDERGRRRLDDPDDIVRLEIGAALARDVRVIPILVESAVMPGRDDLPESLAGLARRNALFIRYESFRSDAVRLVTAVERVLAVPGTAAVPSVPGARDDRSAGKAVGRAAQKVTGPARNDLARAARLLTDAERAAYSITDGSERARAVSAVAKALAATDPDRGAKLLADAERIARSITDEEGDYGQIWPLTVVAEALAATDPYRVAQLLADAERSARSITLDAIRTPALSMVATALAAADPDRAEHIARSITSESSKASTLSGVARVVAAADPDRAERIAQAITDRYLKASTLGGVAKALTATSLPTSDSW